MGILRRLLTPLVDLAYQRGVHGAWSKDLLLALQLQARRESVAYIGEHMREALIAGSRARLHRLAMERIGGTGSEDGDRRLRAEGLYLEFGVKKGATLRGIAAMTPHTVHGFDSFEGLPEDWAGTALARGKFSTGGRLPKVPANVELHVGWFDDTLPAFVATHPGPVAFMHVDCDLYSSTRTIFEHLGERLVPGSVIVFDEYFNYPNWQQHEYRAFQEFVHARAVRYRYLGFVARGGSVAVRITGTGEPP